MGAGAVTARVRSDLGSFVRSPLGSFDTEAEPAPTTYNWDMPSVSPSAEVFQCPGQFYPPAAPFLTRVDPNLINIDISKLSMDPPFPVDGDGNEYYITQIQQIETPTGFVLDMSSVPMVIDGSPPCYDEMPVGYFFDVRDNTSKANPGGDAWQFRVWVDPRNADTSNWIVGTYKFTLDLSPKP